MRKLWKEEIKGLKPESNLFLFLIFFFCYISVYPQVYVDGFIKSKSIKTIEGYDNLYPYDFSKDGKTDFLFYGKPSKQIAILRSHKKKDFYPAEEKFFFYPLTDIKLFRKRKNEPDIHVFVSRNEMLAGLLSFTKYGTLQLLNEFKLDGNPEHIILCDYDHDNSSEGIIFGSNMSGFVLVDETSDLSLSGNTFFPERSFENIMVLDITRDNYPDLICHDPLNNELVFYTNNQDSTFSEERKIKFEEKLYNFNLMDFDDDGFTDIVASTEQGLLILKGDFSNTFENFFYSSSEIPTSNIILDDFNHDYFSDLAFTEKTGVKFFFSTYDSTGFREVDYNRDISYTHLVHLGDFLYASSPQGIISTFCNNENISKNEFELNYSHKFSDAILTDSTFSFLNVDTTGKNIEVLFGNQNIPSYYYQGQLPVETSSAYSFSTGGDDFYILTTDDKTLLQIVAIRRKINMVDKKAFRCGGEILSFHANKELGELFVKTKEDSVYKFSKINLANGDTSPLFELNANEYISSTLGNDALLFWKYSGDRVFYGRRDLKTGDEKLTGTPLFYSDTLAYLSNPLRLNDKDVTVSQHQLRNNITTVFSIDTQVRYTSAGKKNFNLLKNGIIRDGVLLNKKDGVFYKITLNWRKENVVILNAIETIKPDDYLFYNIINNKYYYTVDKNFRIKIIKFDEK